MADLDVLPDETTVPTQAATREEGSAPRSISSRGATIKIRLAESEADIEKLIAIGPRLLEESRYRGLPYSPRKLREAGQRALGNKGQYGVLMATRDDEVVGFLVAIVSEYFFSEELAATAIFYYVAPEYRGSLAAIKLLHGFRNWARNRRVREIHINVTSGIHVARTDRLMKRVGFQSTGGELCDECRARPTAQAMRKNLMLESAPPKGASSLSRFLVRHCCLIAGGLLSQVLGGGAFYVVGFISLGAVIDEWRRRKADGTTTLSPDRLAFPNFWIRHTFNALMLATPIYSAMLFLLYVFDHRATTIVIDAVSSAVPMISSVVPSFEVLESALGGLEPSQARRVFMHLMLVGFVLSTLCIGLAVGLFLRDAARAAYRILEAHELYVVRTTLVGGFVVASIFVYQLFVGGRILISVYRDFSQGAASELIVLGFLFAVVSYCSAVFLIAALVLYHSHKKRMRAG